MCHHVYILYSTYDDRCKTTHLPSEFPPLPFFHPHPHFLYSLITVYHPPTCLLAFFSFSHVVSSHMTAVRNLMSYHGNSTNSIQNEYHIGEFRGYGAIMDNKLDTHYPSLSTSSLYNVWYIYIHTYPLYRNNNYLVCCLHFLSLSSLHRLRDLVRTMNHVKYVECSQVQIYTHAHS